MTNAIDVLRATRISKGITQEKIGKHFGVTKQTISRWELKRTKTPFDIVIKWANVLDVSIDAITNESAGKK